MSEAKNEKKQLPGVLAVIPARGGSKGVPRKNVRLLGDKPLIAHSIQAALGAQTTRRVVVSTDDEEIAEVSRRYGAEVPFMRPVELATDDVPIMPVVQHLAKTLDPEGVNYPVVVILQATNPFKTSRSIDSAVQLLVEHNDCDAVLSVSPVSQHPYRMRTLAENGGVLKPLFKNVNLYAQRQQLPEVYHYNGAIVACWQEVLLSQEIFYGQTHRAIILSETEGRVEGSI